MFKDPVLNMKLKNAIRTERKKRHYYRGAISIKGIKKLGRKARAYSIWRINVFRRDGFRCRKCGKKEKLQAHHILDWQNNRRDRISIKNGITLCFDCHKKIHPWLKSPIDD